MKKPILILLAFVFAMAGCKLDEAGFNQNSIPGANNTAATGTTNPLLLGMWFVKSTQQRDSLSTIVYNIQTKFNASDYFLFNKDNTVNISTSYNGALSGTYSYHDATKILTMSGNGQTNDYTVNKLTTDSLLMTVLVSASAGGPVTYSYLTFKLTH
ncbi:MAG: hypothetical protein JWQ79_3346 [Mucilaginibacter sp.]|nr:hypothetical protein [Mucilaginibacter sp.]